LKEKGAPEIIHRAWSEGHWIGNHTLTQGTPLGQRDDVSAAIDEVGQVQAMLGAFAHPRKFFRPNAGKGQLGQHVLSPGVIDYLCAEKYTVVTWNSVPKDWELPPDG
jgi:peptidoglycan-N-acetylglucosamine deacetylase